MTEVGSMVRTQQDLFKPVLEVYTASGNGEVANDELYKRLSATAGITQDQWDVTSPVGIAAQQHSLPKRQVRWIQQTLKQLGAIERVPGKRGVWRVVAKPTDELTPARPGVVLVGFSTNLGLALWADCGKVFANISEPIHLILTSPPFPLRSARAYGNPDEHQFIDFICRMLEPLVKNLVAGGSLCLNISNDIFLKGAPARSLYVERTILALHDRLGLFLQDRLIWENPCKPPGPTYWACRTRQQLVHTWEPVLWFSNDPVACFADNRRVLKPHSDQNSKLIAAGGETRTASYGDGAYKLRPGSFGNETRGTIPRNILRFKHGGQEVQQARAAALAAGLPVHGAMMPTALAKFLIEFLTPEEALVADPCGGWATTGLAAEESGRRWLVTEQMAQYVAGAAWRFRNKPGFMSSFDLESIAA